VIALVEFHCVSPVHVLIAANAELELGLPLPVEYDIYVFDGNWRLFVEYAIGETRLASWMEKEREGELISQ